MVGTSNKTAVSRTKSAQSRKSVLPIDKKSNQIKSNQTDQSLFPPVERVT